MEKNVSHISWNTVKPPLEGFFGFIVGIFKKNLLSNNENDKKVFQTLVLISTTFGGACI